MPLRLSDSRALLVCLLAVLYGVLTWQVFSNEVPDASLFLYVVPVGLASIAWRYRGAAVTIAISLGLTRLFALFHAVAIDREDYGIQVLTFAWTGLLGSLVGARVSPSYHHEQWIRRAVDLAFVTDLNWRFIQIAPTWRMQVGYETDDLVGCELSEFIHPDDRPRLDEQTRPTPLRTGVNGVDVRFRARDGSWRWLSLAARVDGDFVYGAATDATGRKAAEEQLQALATKDALTGLPNRRAWEERLAHEVRVAQRLGEPLAFVVIDLDRLKAVNDTFGHAAGDRFILDAVHGWIPVIRQTDFLARIGGDEFCLLLPGSSLSEAQHVLDRMRASMIATSSFSAGLALWDGLEPPPALAHRADMALYRAKRAGRGVTEVADGDVVTERLPFDRPVAGSD